MILPVFAYGSPVLRKIAADVEPDYPGLETLIQDMFQTMHSADGVGLAAPQIGKAIRIFLVDARIYGDEYEDLKEFKKVFINAHILEEWGDEELISEGCLSVPNIHEDILRKSHIRMSYVDEQFIEHEDVFEGMAARIIQHEYDHLEGVLFPDKVSPLKKRLLKGKLRDISTGNIKVSYNMIFPNKK